MALPRQSMRRARTCALVHNRCTLAALMCSWRPQESKAAEKEECGTQGAMMLEVTCVLHVHLAHGDGWRAALTLAGSLLNSHPQTESG